MKHPFQQVLLNEAGDLFFASAKNSLFVYKLTQEPTLQAKLVGTWTDPVDPMYTLKKQQEAKIKALEEQIKKEEEEELKNPTSESAPKRQKTEKKIPKLPTPGPGAPPLHTYIRDIQLSRNQDYLIVSTDNDKAVVVFKLDPSNESNVLTFVKRQPFPKRPSSITTSVDDQTIIVGDKFGDVYTIGLTSTEVLEEKALEPVLGHVSMLTRVLNVKDDEGKEYIITADRDEHIRITNYPKAFIVKKWLFEHEEFISSVMLPSWCDGKVLVSAGGDESIYSWNWQKPEKELSHKFLIHDLIKPFVTDKHRAPEKFQNKANDLREYSVSQVVPLDKFQKIVLIFDRVNAFFVFDLSKEGEFTYVETINTSSDIISATAADDKLFLSVENNENKLEVYSISKDAKFEMMKDDQFYHSVYDANTSDVDTKEDIVPLFTVSWLRKRREH